MSSKTTGKKIFDFGLLRRVFRYASPYKRRFYISVVLAIVLAAISPVRPWLIQLTVNDYVKEGQPLAEQVKLINVIVTITLIQVGLLLVETIFRFYFTYITAWLGQTVVKDLRVFVYRKILRLNLTQYDKTPIGTLTTRTINDIEAINDIFAEGLIPIIADLLSIIAVLVYMFFTDWRLTLVSLAPFPILIVATYFFKEIRGHNQYGKWRQAHQRQPPVGKEHIYQYRNNRQQICDDGNQPFSENIVDGFNIIDGTGSECTNRRFIVLCKIETKNFPVNKHAQIFYHCLPEPGRDISEIKTKNSLHQ